MIQSLLGFICMTLSLAAIADDSPYVENRIDTLHFREVAHQFGSQLNYSASLRDSGLSAPSSGATTSYSRHSESSSINLIYGLRDDLLVGVSESYLFDATNSTSTGTQYLSLGFSDPELHVNYRYWGELTGHHFGSAFFNIIPGFGQAQGADTKQNGNNLRTDTLISVGTDLYWVQGSFEYAVIPSVNYISSGSTEHSNSLNNVNTDDFFTYNLSASARFHFYENFYAELGIASFANYTVDSHYPNRTNVVSSTTKNSSNVKPILAVGWRLDEKAIISLSCNFTHVDQSNSDNTGYQSHYTDDSEFLTLSGHVTF